MSKKVVFSLCAVGFVALLALVAQRAAVKFGTAVKAPDHERPDVWRDAKGCDFVRGVTAAEDITVLPTLTDGSTVALTAGDFRMELWHMEGGGSYAPQGAVFALDVEERELYQLELENFPDTVAFHPHGIHFLPASYTVPHSCAGEEGEGTLLGLLYAVSHAYARGGERVEVLEVWDITKEGASPGIPLRLSYRQSVTSEKYSEALMGVGNDLAVVEEGEFFITQYLTMPDDRQGRQEGGWRAVWNELIFMASVLLGARSTAVWHCTYDVAGDGHSRGDLSEVTTEPHCVVALETVAANGININRQTGEVYVVECIDRAVLVTRQEATGAGHERRLALTSRIELEFACDNLEVDATSGRAFCGAVAKPAEHSSHISAATQFAHGLPSAAEERSGDIPCSLGGGEEVLLEERRAGRAAMVDTSRLCSGVSVATFVEHDGRQEMLLGSWASEGILICPL